MKHPALDSITWCFIFCCECVCMSVRKYYLRSHNTHTHTRLVFPRGGHRSFDDAHAKHHLHVFIHQSMKKNVLCDNCTALTNHMSRQNHTGCCISIYIYIMFSSAASCTPCSPGFYSNQLGATNCTACALGTISTGISGSSSDEISCQPCPVGTFADGQTGGMTTSCSPCPTTGYSATMIGPFMLYIIDIWWICNVGSCTSFTSSCEERQDLMIIPLDRGWCWMCSLYRHIYIDIYIYECVFDGILMCVGATACTRCPAHSLTSSPGATSIHDCIPCRPGTQVTNDDGSMICRACPPGTHRLSNTAAGCEACPAGSYTATLEDAQALECIPCAAMTVASTIGICSNIGSSFIMIIRWYGCHFMRELRLNGRWRGLTLEPVIISVLSIYNCRCGWVSICLAWHVLTRQTCDRLSLDGRMELTHHVWTESQSSWILSRVFQALCRCV